MFQAHGSYMGHATKFLCWKYMCNRIYLRWKVDVIDGRICGIYSWFHLQNEIKTRWRGLQNGIGFHVHHIYFVPKFQNWNTRPIMLESPKTWRVKRGGGAPYIFQINKSRRSHIVFCHVAVFGQVLTKTQDPSSLSFKDPGALYVVFHDITSPGNDRFFRGSEKTVVLGLQKIAQSEHMSIPMTDPWEW